MRRRLTALRELLGRSPVSFTRRAWLWPILVLASLVFAQSLRLPISHVLFVFVLILPLGTALQLIAARLSIATANRSGFVTVEKRTPARVSAIASNDGLLPFPFIEAHLRVPDRRGARCTHETVAFSLAPFGAVELKREMSFAFRGLFEVGLDRIFVYDIFRCVSLRIECERLSEVFVLPRRFELPSKALAAESDITTKTVLRRKGSDNTEASDIRAYLPGDSPKSIHWKLSTKSEEPVVRDYSKNSGSSVYILCDLEPHYKTARGEQLFTPRADCEEVIDNLVADMTVEHTLAAALRELRAANSVTLLWLSEEDDVLTPHSAELDTQNDFEAAFRAFAPAPVVERGSQLTLLAGLIPEDGESSLIAVTGCLSPAAVEELTRISAARSRSGEPACEVIYVSDASIYVSDAAASEEEARRLAALSRFANVTRGGASG